MVKTKGIHIGILFLILLIAGCGKTEIRYQCSDGLIVSDASNCPKTERSSNDEITSNVVKDTNNEKPINSVDSIQEKSSFKDTEIVLINNPTDLCESFSGEDKWTCYNKLAMDNKSYQYCEKIEDVSRRDWCYYVVGTDTQNSYVCDLASTSSECEWGGMSCKDACYVAIAEDTKSSSNCEKVTNSKGRDDCYFNLVIFQRLPLNLCKEIQNSKTKDDCYYSSAQKNSNLDFCNPITSDESRDICYMVIIRDLKLNDIKLCERFRSVQENGIRGWKHACESEISTGNYLSS